MVVAAQNVFHDAHVTGCYFRFAQTLFKKWTEYNLGVIYGNEKSQAGNIARMTFRFFNFLNLMWGNLSGFFLFLFGDLSTRCSLV
ncbi:unnamed protein product [Meloidogyne enterolobii]|uniref:Uncharacterized protein n=1 Tax=Meloidogyne enterolobii TaxID=390850 RepID=A0ACB0XZX2_MELEN